MKIYGNFLGNGVQAWSARLPKQECKAFYDSRESEKIKNNINSAKHNEDFEISFQHTSKLLLCASHKNELSGCCKSETDWFLESAWWELAFGR